MAERGGSLTSQEGSVGGSKSSHWQPKQNIQEQYGLGLGSRPVFVDDGYQ